MLIRYLLPIFIAIVLTSCSRPRPEEQELVSKSWDEITSKCRGTTVRMAMWDGDPAINAYMRSYVREQLDTQFGIDLRFVGGHGAALVNRFMTEMDAGRSVGDLDVVWINGETFYQLRQIEALYGPFTDLLPNNQLINWQDPFIALDFQQPISGYECPWGNVQQAIIYRASRVKEPPQSKESLAVWIKQNPGRFTFDNGFTGMTFLKSLLYDFAGGPASLRGAFDEAKYIEASNNLWMYLRDIQPFLWREGKTFPEDVAQLHRLMVNGEVDFSFSNNDGEVDNKVDQGILPADSRAYVWKVGTIRNSHYLGIPKNAPNKAGALTLINFLISPEAQAEKSKPAVWGDGTVLDPTKLSADEARWFDQVPERQRVAGQNELAQRALMEPAPEIMIRLYRDFRRAILEGP